MKFTAAGDAIIQQRIHKAKILLRDGKQTVTQIAAKTGFNTVHYFSKMFKKTYGISPKKYSREV